MYRPVPGAPIGVETVDMPAPGTFWARVAADLRRRSGDPIPKAALGGFFYRLAALLASGQSVPECLRAAAGADPELRWLAETAAGPTSMGAPLYRALAPCHARLPEIVLPVLEVGEVSGTLESASRRLADAFDRSSGVERKFEYTVFNPRFVLLLLAFESVVFGFAPSLASSIGVFLMALLKLAVFYLVLRFVARIVFRWRWLRRTVDTIKLALPVVGMVSRCLSAARWARSFATLWRCGVPVSSALEVSSRSALNAHYEAILLDAARRTREGSSLADALERVDLLPPYLREMVRAGETSGDLSPVLESLAKMLEDDALTRGSQAFMTANAVMTIVIALVIVAMSL